jgi:hypothetical protein
MSSPPRTKLTLRPLKVSGGATPADPGSDDPANIGHASTASGLEWVMRVNLDQLIRNLLPDFDGGSGCGTWGDTTQNHPHLRLRCCLVLARAMNQLGGPVGRDGIDALRDVPFETMCDELRELNAAIDPVPLALPSMGLMMPADKMKRPADMSIHRVFYVLSRLYGTTFVSGASAMVAGRLNGNVCLDLWLPI